jgi:pilus assembly protein Flp/PilA
MDREQASSKLWRWWRRACRDVRGATAIEYGLIVSLVVIAMFAALAEVGRVTGGMWNNVSAQVIAAH